MVKNIISLVLLIVSAALHFKHGWDSFNTPHPQQLHMIAQLGLTAAALPYIGTGVILLGVFLLFPRTFVFGNLANACIVALIIAFGIKAGNHMLILIEVPFFVMPLVMIWLGYPFRKHIRAAGSR